jgi:hypothetical protein
MFMEWNGDQVIEEVIRRVTAEHELQRTMAEVAERVKKVPPAFDTRVALRPHTFYHRGTKRNAEKRRTLFGPAVGRPGKTTRRPF